MTQRLTLIILFIGTLLTSCSKSPEEQIALINGYWEIAKIENNYGSSKEYSISQNVDFFEVNAQGKGIRKKVQPDICLLYTSPSPRDRQKSRMPSSA